MEKLKFGIAFVPNNFDYELLDNCELSFRDLKVMLIAGPFDTMKEAAEASDSFFSDSYKFGHEKLIINYNSNTMKNIEF